MAGAGFRGPLVITKSKIAAKAPKEVPVIYWRVISLDYKFHYKHIRVAGAGFRGPLLNDKN